MSTVRSSSPTGKPTYLFINEVLAAPFLSLLFLFNAAFCLAALHSATSPRFLFLVFLKKLIYFYQPSADTKIINPINPIISYLLSAKVGAAKLLSYNFLYLKYFLWF